MALAQQPMYQGFQGNRNPNTPNDYFAAPQSAWNNPFQNPNVQKGFSREDISRDGAQAYVMPGQTDILKGMQRTGMSTGMDDPAIARRVQSRQANLMSGAARTAAEVQHGMLDHNAREVYLGNARDMDQYRRAMAEAASRRQWGLMQSIGAGDPSRFRGQPTQLANFYQPKYANRWSTSTGPMHSYESKYYLNGPPQQQPQQPADPFAAVNRGLEVNAI